MRRSLAVVLALAAASLNGCVAPPSDGSVGHYEARVPFHGLTGDDVVQLDVFMVERPAADRCINREVWELADEEILKDKKSLLEENGLRACVLGDSPPDGLRTLLRSERSCATRAGCGCAPAGRRRSSSARPRQTSPSNSTRTAARPTWTWTRPNACCKSPRA